MLSDREKYVLKNLEKIEGKTIYESAKLLKINISTLRYIIKKFEQLKIVENTPIKLTKIGKSLINLLSKNLP